MNEWNELEVLFAPAEQVALAKRDLSRTTCVVFDVLRATSTIVTALANGAAEVTPMAEIFEALELRKQRPEILLAGERDGLRICAEQTGGTDFDLGNSPREFTPERVKGRAIALTTTNGSRALRACSGAKDILACSFLNLAATASFLQSLPPESLMLVCSGTGKETAYEDVLGAGALIKLLLSKLTTQHIPDSASMALQLYDRNKHDLLKAIEHCRNGRRLLQNVELRDDVPWCLQADTHPVVARLAGESLRAACNQ